MENFKMYMEQFFSMGFYAYFIIGFIAVTIIFYFVGMKLQKNAKQKWVDTHPGATTIAIKSGNNFITQKQLTAKVISGEAAVFLEKGKHIILAMPGDVVLEVTYTYTRPGVVYKSVSTTWGPAKVSLHIEANKQYSLTFDREKKEFVLDEV